MPTELLIEIIGAILVLAPQIPEIVALGESAVSILTTGTVSAEQEAAIRAQLDAVRAAIDAA
jgi:hypothetical protein